VGIFTIAFLLLAGIVFPVAVLRSARQMQHVENVPRSQLYLSTVVSQGILLIFAIAAAWERRLDVFGTFRWTWASVAITTGWTWVQIGYLVYSLRHEDFEKHRFASLLSPRTRRERIQWVGLGVMAAVGEEIVYRAVLFAIFYAWFGSWLAAALGSAAIFGVSHAVQGAKGGLLAGLLGLGNQALVLVTGSLWYAIASHFAYDFVAVMAIGALAARREAERVTRRESQASPPVDVTNANPENAAPARTPEVD
jgi:membrane protease YdiL (CAAX protease family)